jgi:hypothetical protein
MDIQLHEDGVEVVSPQPWVVRHSETHLEELIRGELAHDPQATPDQIVERLAHKQVEVAGTYVASLLGKWRQGEQ